MHDDLVAGRFAWNVLELFFVLVEYFQSDVFCDLLQDEDLKRVFLPPPEYSGVTYSHNKLDSPTFDHRHPIHTEPKHPYTPSDTDSCRKSPWQYEGKLIMI